MAPTHEVLNQVPPYADVNLYTSDPPLVEALRREGGAWAEDRVRAFGALMGTAETFKLGFEANANKPILRTHDRWGNRLDEVEFHPSWHALLTLSMQHGLHNLPWREPQDGATVARAALFLIAGQVESGHGCPISMTCASVPSLRMAPAIAAEWEPRVHGTAYDRRFVPASQKSAVLLGMAMTEKQGGSDVRAGTTRAEPLGDGDEVAITGHKWFCSAPMCDGFLVLAQGPRGLTCYFMPRFTPDGQKNRFYIQRLKDKLGNQSNASSEVEFDRAWARRVGEDGRGVPTIIEMANHTRLDCVIGSASLMRAALAQALHHAEHRRAFGRRLIEQPLMRHVLADLAVESEAATVLTMRLARAFDRGHLSKEEDAFRRIATAVGKYWVTKRGVAQVFEGLECLGGNGFVEESITARMHRESPLNSIWEGSGNVMCLDVLRAMVREPASFDAFLAEVRLAGDKRVDAFVGGIQAEIGKEELARRLVEKMAVALQASLLIRHAPAAVADAYCATRLGGDWGHTFGTLPSSVDVNAILKRVTFLSGAA